MPRYTLSVCSHLRPLSSFSFPASLLAFSPLSSVPSFPFQEQKPCSKTVCESPALKQITSLGFWKPLGALQRMASEKHSAAATYEELPERPFSALLPSSPLSPLVGLPALPSSPCTVPMGRPYRALSSGQFCSACPREWARASCQCWAVILGPWLGQTVLASHMSKGPGARHSCPAL